MAMKGAGKGKASVNCNVPGMPNSSIDGLPYAGVAVFRESADQAVEFCTKLQAAMAPYAAGEVHFENIDVSNIQWPLIAFSLLLEVLQEKGASTKRLKAFKAGLDDECMNCTATWIEQLKPETLPSEIHLSHNSISQKGLETLLNAIELQRAQLPRQAMPIWLRVENNQVDISEQSAVMQALLAQGRVVQATKIGDRVPSAAAVAMPDFKKAWAQGGQPQRAGPAMMALGGGAPAAPNGKGAWAGGQANAAWWTGAGGGNGGGSWWAGGAWAQGNAGSWGGAAWQQPPQPQVQQQPQPVQVVMPPAWQAAAGTRAGQAGTAADRSRTPAARKAAEPKLPPNWEKQWSDEYQIPYFWNSLTGESLWEPPE